MYCDHTSNSQLWFCTKGYINRAYISLPANEFCSNAVLEDIEEFDGSMYISGDLGLYKGLINDSIRFQFEKPEVLKRPTSKLLKSKTTDGEVLLAATTDGLFQLDIFDEVSTVLDQIEITALKNDLSDPASIMSGSNDGILRTIKYSDDGWAVSDVRGIETVNGAVSAIEQTAIGEWWVLTARPGRLYRLLFNLSDPTLAQYDNSKGLPSDSLNHIVLIDNILYVCTNRGLYSYNTEKDFFEKDTMLVGESFNNAQVNRLLKTTEGEIVISGYDTRNFDALVTPTRQGYVVFKRQFDFLPDIPTIDIEYFDGNIWLVKGRNIYVIDKSKLGYSYGSFKTIFTNITAGSGRVLMNGLFYTTSHRGTRIPSSSQPEGMVPVLKYSENNISFRWTTTSYVEEEKTEYRYRLDGFDRDWSGWEKRNYKDFTNLPFGNYKFRLRAKTITGLESEETVFAFSIRRPWYAAITALFIYVILGSMIVFFTIRWFTKRIRDENKRLENLVRQGKEEVIRQKDELEKDIHYASRIQRALLSTEKFLAQRTSNYFILFKPRDIVSGDFYWVANKEERLFVVTADCSGNGVAGAFMSLLGISFLDEIVGKQASVGAGQVINELRTKIIASLKQIGETDEQKNGMELSLLVLDYKNRKVEFAGAYNPCFKVRAMNEEEIMLWERGKFETDSETESNGRYLLETVNASKMPVGISTKTNQDFIQSEWKMEKTFSYYLFTDGYLDQFNGLTGKKFLRKNFRKLILDVQDFPMNKQQEILGERFKSWMGSSPQTDDVLVIGFKAD
jgi:serine phosphatase RsbU (regulator of sigma subunit)